MAKDFATAIRYLAESIIDGTLNPNYGDPYAWNAAEKDDFAKQKKDSFIKNSILG